VTSFASLRARLAEALARRRVPLGFGAGALVLWLAQPTPRSLLTGTGVVMAGEALRVWAAGHVSKSREVTTSGPYRFVRHPLYVGSSMMGFGLALACRSLAVAVVIAVYLMTTLLAAIAKEEAFLLRTFGGEYDRYRRGLQLSSEEPRAFSLERAIANHEHRTLAGVGVALLLLILKATYNGVFWGAAGH